MECDSKGLDLLTVNTARILLNVYKSISKHNFYLKLFNLLIIVFFYHLYSLKYTSNRTISICSLYNYQLLVFLLLRWHRNCDAYTF